MQVKFINGGCFTLKTVQFFLAVSPLKLVNAGRVLLNDADIESDSNI